MFRNELILFETLARISEVNLAAVSLRGVLAEEGDCAYSLDIKIRLKY